MTEKYLSIKILFEGDFQSDIPKRNAWIVIHHLPNGDINTGGDVIWMMGVKGNSQIGTLLHENMNDAFHKIVRSWIGDNLL